MHPQLQAFAKKCKWCIFFTCLCYAGIRILSKNDCTVGSIQSQWQVLDQNGHILCSMTSGYQSRLEVKIILLSICGKINMRRASLDVKMIGILFSNGVAFIMILELLWWICLAHCRFELDMLLETTAVTTQRMEELLQKLQEVNCKQNSQVQMGDYLKGNC